MASWRKRARLGVAIFGLAVAAVVYMGMGERRIAAPHAPVQRSDPKALFEMRGSTLTRHLPESIRRVADIDADVQGYDDGSLRLTKIRKIIVRRGDREYVITGSEGYVGPNSEVLELTGDVKVVSSDGFELRTTKMTFEDDVARSAEAVSFSKGRMSGSGIGVSWDQNTEVLTIEQQAHVVTTDDEGNTLSEMNASFASLDRLQNLLLLNSGAHVVKNNMSVDARDAIAQLSPNEDVITFLKLLGEARVTGAGASIDAMSARDMDLDYVDDGSSLERVTMRGGSAIVMTGQNGRSGRTIQGESLDLRLAPDGSLVAADGKGKVQLDLPAAASAPKRTISSAVLAAKGQAGRGLTDATFTGDVVFTEEPARGTGRRVRSRELRVALANDAVTSATFTGRAAFEEPGLLAAAAQVDYLPDKGSLVLSGVDGTAIPCVADERLTVDGQTINVGLEARRFNATGSVRTTLRGQARGTAPCGGRTVPAAQAKAGAGPASRLPGLLDQKESASVTADTLDYHGAAGRIVYSGKVSPPTMVQGKTYVRAGVITIEQGTGDLTATGDVLVTLVLDGQDAQARTQELQFSDAKRLLTLTGAPVPPAPAAPTGHATLNGPQGQLAGWRIDVVLGRGEAAVERIEAIRDVSLTAAPHLITGASRLRYRAADGQYTIEGAAQSPLLWLLRDGNECRENSGARLTFRKGSADGAELDGQSRWRFETKPKQCPPALSATPVAR